MVLRHSKYEQLRRLKTIKSRGDQIWSPRSHDKTEVEVEPINHHHVVSSAYKALLRPYDWTAIYPRIASDQQVGKRCVVLMGNGFDSNEASRNGVNTQKLLIARSMSPAILNQIKAALNAVPGVAVYG